MNPEFHKGPPVEVNYFFHKPEETKGQIRAHRFEERAIASDYKSAYCNSPKDRWRLNMFDDDLEPRKNKKFSKKLDSMSLDELAAYIDEMKEEIQRAELEIERRESPHECRFNLFKSK